MIFYSEHCNVCRNIMMILKNENLLQNFKIICVDNILDKLPPDMKVPLMRLVNVPEPLFAQSIYNWISQIKFMRTNTNTNSNSNPNLNPNSNGIIPQQQFHKKQSGPYSFDADVMTKISDSFAFADEKMNEPLPQSYFGINQEETNAIYTPQDPHNSKIKKEEQKKILSEIEARRTQQNNEFVQYSKQVQLELIMQDEYDKQQGATNINGNGNTPMQMPVPINKPKKGITLIKH